MCLLKLTRERKQSHIPGPLNCSFYLTLTTSAIAASFAGKYLAAIGQKLAEGIDVLVIDIVDLVPAKTALALFTNSRITSSFPFLAWFISGHSHFYILPQLNFVT
jgi:hypothetical protein